MCSVIFDGSQEGDAMYRTFCHVFPDIIFITEHWLKSESSPHEKPASRYCAVDLILWYGGCYGLNSMMCWLCTMPQSMRTVCVEEQFQVII